MNVRRHVLLGVVLLPLVGCSPIDSPSAPDPDPHPGRPKAVVTTTKVLPGLPANFVPPAPAPPRPPTGISITPNVLLEPVPLPVGDI